MTTLLEQVLRKAEFDEERFLSWVVLGENECWIWTGDRSGQYGAFRDSDGIKFRANRWSLEHFTGETLGKLWACHLCPNPRCVNPFHLYPGTAADNNADTVRDGHHHYRRRTHCPRGHAYDESNTYRQHAKRRTCRKCRVILGQARRNRRREAEQAAGYFRPRNKGADNPSSKVSESTVREIKALCSSKNRSPNLVTNLAKQHGLRISSIYNIINGVTWKHLS